MSKRHSKPKKNLPPLIITFSLWLLTSSIIFFVSPTPATIPLFFLLLFLTLFFTLSLIFKHRRRTFLISSAIIIFLTLRYFAVGNLLNLLLLIGVVITFEIYLSSHS